MQKSLFRVVEKSNFLNRLRNVHLEKSAVTGLFHPSRSLKTAKTSLKVHLRLRFQNPGKPRTAGLCGRAAGACDCGPLSCTKIERPSLLEKPPCKVRFFANRYSRKYRQKVTVTTLFQTTSHRTFSTSHTNAPRSLSRVKAGTHSAFGERSHTRAHTAKQGHSLPRPQCGFALPVNSFLFRHAFIYIHFPVLCEPTISRREKVGQSFCHKFYLPTAFHPVFQLLAQMAHVCLHSESGYTLGFQRKIAHSGSQGETGVLWMGALSLPSDRFARSGNPAWPEGRTAYFAPFGSWPRVLSKNAESLRDSDALMRVAVPRRRGPAGLRDLFRFCRNCGLYALRSGPFRVCEAKGGITTLSALYVLLKRWTAACQKGSFAVF